MFDAHRRGPVVCRSCGRLVDVTDDRCPHCGARWPALWGYSRLLRRLGGLDVGLAKVILGSCVALYALSLLIDVAGIRMGGFLDILGPAPTSLYRLGAAGILPVWQHGRWWTVLSAGWLHGSLLHIFFNMYWVWYLVPQVAQVYGAGRTLVIYTVASASGFLLSSCGLVLLSQVSPGLARLLGQVLGTAGITIGASAALMGLLGVLIAYGRRGGPSYLVGWAGRYVIIFLLFGLFLRSVDNWAHLGGLIGGYLCGVAMDPSRPERLNDLLAGAACLLATLLAIVASFVTV